MKLYAVKNDEGEWLSSDGTQTGIWYSNNPTLFKYKSHAEARRMGHRAHVVELTEEQKVKLPQDVGKELDDWMADNQDGWGGCIDDLLYDIVNDEPDLFHVIDFADDSEENYFKILDAYRYGWEAEKPKWWNVKVPHVPLYYWKKSDGGIGIDDLNVATAYDDTDVFEFTESEINHYGLQDCEKEEVADDAND